jgi:hypothetical protein
MTVLAPYVLPVATILFVAAALWAGHREERRGS